MITRVLCKIVLATAFVALLQGCLDGGDNNSPVEEVTLATPNRFLEFFNQYDDPGLGSVNYAQAYYDAIDPANRRDTLDKFISHHQNDGSDWTNVIFHDLGWGRDIHMRQHNNANGCEEIAFYVRNFAIEFIPISSPSYDALSLEAAINNDTEFHIGTSAIEVSHADDDDDCSGPRFLKFFTYAPTGERLLSSDFDGRGVKSVPQSCVSCHGGILRPLDSNGDFTTTYANDSAIGDTKSRLMPFSVETLGFTDTLGFESIDTPGFTRADMEPGIKAINDAILSTYPEPPPPNSPPTGEWQGAFAREILEGHYPETSPGQQSPIYIDDFVPSGWRMAEGRPADTDLLYLNVIRPHCIVCHAGQGTDLGLLQFGGGPPRPIANREGQDIDFQTWEKFESYADDIARLVFGEGRMPMSLLQFEAFWNDPEKPKLLASFIAAAPSVSDFEIKYVNDDGSIKRPGRPIANAGLDRHIPPNTPITLDGGSSLFANQFRWEVVKTPPNANPTLDLATSSMPMFTTDTAGVYELSLTASNDGQMSHTDTVTLNVSEGAQDPALLSFVTHVRPILQDPAGGCVVCHAKDSFFPGVPVWFTDQQPDVSSLSLYERVRALVNLTDVPNSLLLTKASGRHHAGSQRRGFGVDSDGVMNSVGEPVRASYDLFVNWIYAGAPE